MVQDRGDGGQRRAPRLGPDDRLAPYLTRVGRFAKLDPLKAAPRPTVAQMLGVVGWLVLTVESLRRARGLLGRSPAS
jgi:hypothetical protein